MCCCFQNDGTQDLFSFLAVGWMGSLAHLVLNLLTISVPVVLLYVEAAAMTYKIYSVVHP